MHTAASQYDPANSTGWIKDAELKTALEDFPRAEATIFELGVSQSALAMPELLWKAYIDFEADEQGDREKARLIYEHLIGLSGHHKVWISFAEFEGSPIPLACALRDEDEDKDNEGKMVPGNPELAQQVFEWGYKDLKSKGLKSEVRLDFSGITPIPTMPSACPYWRHGWRLNKPMVQKQMLQKYRA